MARSLKVRGVEEIDSIRRRARRQHSLGRISKPDADWLVRQLNKIESRIVSMRETNEYGEEED